MGRCLTLVHRFHPKSPLPPNFRTAVSLHSHPMHSKEYLERLPRYISKFPIGSYIIEWELGRLHLYKGWNFDFNKYFWTPPLSPREAYELECGQIEKTGLRALISLTDHDNIEAGLQLKILPGMKRVPISVEWTVPYEATEFHLGVHNLPGASAMAWMKELAGYTANPQREKLRQLLMGLHDEKSVLLVLNHPYWDAESIGPEEHRKSLKSFLENFREFVHALELNGMRSRRENREVLRLGEELEMPVISGGDRHGCEPNAVLNLTEAQNFEEFVNEVREEQQSEILLMPQFFEPLQVRLIENAWHALADAPGEFGRHHWMSRVFIEEKGEAKPLSQFTGTRFHRVVDKFRWVVSLVANPILRPALKLPFLGSEEGGL